MIRNFEEIKKQLADLAEVVNGFKSEAVQLRIIERLLGLVGSEEMPPARPAAQGVGIARTQKRAKKTSGGTSGNPAKKTPKSSSGKKPKGAVDLLRSDGFFKSKRTAAAVQDHLQHSRAMTFTVGALQMVLNRLVQNNEMKREKNAQKQYEYWTE